MAKSSAPPTRNEVIRRYRRAARGEFALFFSPLLSIPLVLLAMQALVKAVDAMNSGEAPPIGPDGTQVVADATTLPLYWYVGAICVCLLFPLWALVKTTLTSRYTITRDTVMSEEGFISRRSSEIRIQDIRNFTVQQNIAERLVGIGNVAFSSSAGDRDEVVFVHVSKPESVKLVVKDIQQKVADGVLDVEERAELGMDPAPAPEPAKVPAKSAPQKAASAKVAPASSAPAAAPASDDADRDELYRLLEEQQAAGAQDEET